MADDTETSSHDGEGRRIVRWDWTSIAEAVDGELTPAEPRCEGPHGVSTDTRTIEPGELFVALRGPNFDGHDFVEEAFEKGAAGAVVATDVEREVEPSGDGVLIRVDSTLEALQSLGAALWREARREGLHTIAITGSNGKTTTKELAAALWSTRGRVHKTSGNLNNHIGLPLTLCDLPADCDHLVVEIGGNAPGEIGELIALAPGDERIVTSIGLDHPEGFGSIEGVRRAKAEIATSADDSTTMVVPADEREALVSDEYPGDVWTFGSDREARLRLCDTESLSGSHDAQRVTFVHDDHRWSMELPLPGTHNACNLAAAVSTLLARGVSVEAERWTEAVRSVALPGGRWRRVAFEGLHVVDDAYNANPSSVRASLDAFTSCDDGFDGEAERLAVVGEMAELGERSQSLHCEVARDAAARDALDAIVFQGAHAEAMVEAARSIAPDADLQALDDLEAIAEWMLDRRPAIAWLKASRAAELERVVTCLEHRLPVDHEA